MAAYPKPVPQSPSVTPKPWRWLWTPHHGWGVLQLGDTVYAVREVEYEEADGTPRLLVKLRKVDGTEYQLTPDQMHGFLCDCPWGSYKPVEEGFKSCKHRAGVLAAYEQLREEQRLADFVAGPDDPTVALISEGWCRGAPDHLADDVVQIDATAAASMKCGRCRRKGLTFQAWHRARQYAATASCPVCHAVEQI